MSLVQNERTKLLATALNNTAVAIVITAVIGPIAGYLNGVTTLTGPLSFFFGALWFLVGVVLHIVAQVILGRLRP